MAIDVPERSREVTVSTNRQVGLASDFARAMKVKPRARLLEMLVRLPGGAYGVLLMKPPRSFAGLLAETLEGSGRGGTRFLRTLRGEWSGRTGRTRR